MKTVILMRGLPGSGKTTFVAKNYPGAEICSADHFLVDEHGHYVWTPPRLARAHILCQGKFMQALQDQKPLVVVDNCNIAGRDMRYYVEAAKAAGYEIKILTVKTPMSVAMTRQTHGVPADKYPVLQGRLAAGLPPDLAPYEQEVVGDE